VVGETGRRIGEARSVMKTRGLGTTMAAIGRAQWTWSLPLTAPVGPAVASVSCGGSARISRRFTVPTSKASTASISIVPNYKALGA
jgi:hypothetical protein